MSLFTLPTDLTKVENALERIASALERAYPPSRELREKRIRGPESLVDISAEAVEDRRKLDDFLSSQGLSEAEIVAEKKKIEELPDAVRMTLLRNISEGM